MYYRLLSHQIYSLFTFHFGTLYFTCRPLSSDPRITPTEFLNERWPQKKNNNRRIIIDCFLSFTLPEITLMMFDCTFHSPINLIVVFNFIFIRQWLPNNLERWAAITNTINTIKNSSYGMGGKCVVRELNEIESTKPKIENVEFGRIQQQQQQQR